MNKQQKFWLIELLAYWEGGVNTSALIRCAGGSRPPWQTALDAYHKIATNNLSYCSSKKQHLSTDSFKMHFITGEVDEYLRWLDNPKAFPQFSDSGKRQVSHVSMFYPERYIAPGIVRKLVKAIKEKRYVDVSYKSLKHPDGGRRVIAPHSLVNTGIRWHVRAWCENNNAFRDFVLNRFVDDMDVIEPANIDPANDDAWNTQVTLRFMADPRLSQEKKQILESDYKMENGEFAIQTRGCLVDYQLKALQVNPKILDGNADAQQLVLANLDDIKPWLF